MATMGKTLACLAIFLVLMTVFAPTEVNGQWWGDDWGDNGGYGKWGGGGGGGWWPGHRWGHRWSGRRRYGW